MSVLASLSHAHMEPDILIVDEVLAVETPNSKKCLEKWKKSPKRRKNDFVRQP